VSCIAGLLGLAVLDEAEVAQVEDRFGLALVGLQLFGYWCLVVPGVLQVNTHDWWIGLIVARWSSWQLASK
jgi:hypothetical protein